MAKPLWRRVWKWVRGDALWEFGYKVWEVVAPYLGKVVAVILAALSGLWLWLKHQGFEVWVLVVVGTAWGVVGLGILAHVVYLYLRKSRIPEKPETQPETVHERRERLLATRQPVLRYEGIDGQMWGQISPGTPTNILYAKIHNVQVAMRNTAANCVANIEYRHDSGEFYRVTKAAWLTKDDFSHAAFIESDDIAKLVVLTDVQHGEEQGWHSSFSEERYSKEMDYGHWSWSVLVTIDNGEPLYLEGGFRFNKDGGFVPDVPAALEESIPPTMKS